MSCYMLLCPVSYYCVLCHAIVSCVMLLYHATVSCVMLLYHATVSCVMLLCPVSCYCVQSEAADPIILDFWAIIIMYWANTNNSAIYFSVIILQPTHAALGAWGQRESISPSSCLLAASSLKPPASTSPMRVEPQSPSHRREAS